MRWFQSFISFSLIIGLCACTTTRDQTINRAAKSGFIRQDITASPFTLATWHRLTPGATTLYVYLEGDGRAWISRTRPSTDPTPRTPLALRFASQDAASSVAYLARPCQYVRCTPDRDYVYWTSARFAPEVITASRKAIDLLQQQAKAQHVVLIGYSGGGVLAALIAAQTPAVSGLITVAAPLDIQAWVRHHNLSPLARSENPLSDPVRLHALPQVHLSGGADTTVPTAILRSYVQTLKGSCLSTRTVSTATHNDNWPTPWQRPALPICGKGSKNTE